MLALTDKPRSIPDVIAEQLTKALQALQSGDIVRLRAHHRNLCVLHREVQLRSRRDYDLGREVGHGT